MADSIIDIALIVGLFGGVAAYFTDFQGFKKWVDGLIGGSCEAGKNWDNLPDNQRWLTLATLVAVYIKTFATSPSSINATTLATAIASGNRTQMANLMSYINAHKCTTIENLNKQELWTIMRNTVIAVASARKISIKSIPTTVPTGYMTSVAQIVRMR